MNNDINNPNNKKKPFKVNIEDDGFLNPEELNQIKTTPVSPPKKKFEVHIDDNALPQSYDDQTPQYKGEVYFSNRKPQRRAPQQRVTQQPQYTDVNNGTSQESKTKKAKFSFSAAVWIVVAIFTITFSAISIICINDVLGLNRSDEIVKITIPQNSTTNSIIDILDDEGLVKQSLFCKVYFKAIDIVKNINKDKKPAAPVYLSGVYYVQKNMGLEGYLNEFREHQKTADTVTLVFPEGWTIYQIINKISEFGVCSKDQLLASIEGTDFEYSFINEIPADSKRTFALEGYIYPSTYEFYEKSDANTVLRKFLDASENKWTEEYEAQRIALGLTRDEVIIIASIIQSEAANKDQMGLVSSVIHNRLDNSVSWPLLGCDSTENYVEKYIAPNVASSEASLYQNSYDTYTQPGLPPGPICNPGDDAIHAALFPEDTDYFYFRHDKYGKIYMARTQAEHDQNGREVLRVNSR
ncbi:MAG: endolytic transglycosylase MltG [Acutalibacteraceae bacterium]|nr:endolytic transglycosylase MltG [Acutalibacteraceae bacterium]